MAKIHEFEQGVYVFYCPGCKCGHYVNVSNPSHKAAWMWNGSLNTPTFTPSIKTWTGESVCHSFVRDGKIEFLGDCTHDLAGKTVELPEWEE